MIRILIVEDSPVAQRILRALLSDEPGIEIVGMANNGLEALDLCRKLTPDLVTMDIFMPKMDGLQATRMIMSECPTRIVIISSQANSLDIRSSFEAMRLGAIDIIEKPYGADAGNYASVKNGLIRVIKKMIEVKPEAQLAWLSSLTSGSKGAPPSAQLPDKTRETTEQLRQNMPQVVCIAGSTGAPVVIEKIISALPQGFPIPILIVQHIAAGFVESLADWLGSSAALRVKVAADGDALEPGLALIAPSGAHLLFESKSKVRIVAPQEISQRLHVPSANVLFESAAETFSQRSLGIILTGMGNDGAAGLLKMRRAGAMTLGQNEASSAVYGMPKSAFEMGAVTLELDPRRMIERLLRLKDIAEQKPSRST